MSSNASGALAHLGLLRFSGRDALAFLQGQISNDTRRLAAGEPLLAACSTPQGRVIAVLHLLPHPSGVLAILPRELVPELAGRLRRFVLRAKVEIADLSEDYLVAGHHGTAALAAAGFAAGELATAGLAPAGPATDGIGIARVTRGADRFWVVGPAALVRTRGLAGEAQPARIEHDWRLADIRAGLPQVYGATSEQFVAQMLNLDLLDGISFTKGCYTGQEIIARTQHLGRIKRRMFRLALPLEAVAIGEALTLADGRTGRVTDCARVAEGCEVLAVLPLEAAPSEAAAEPGAARPETADEAGAAGAPVRATPLPLPYPLAAAGS